MPQKIFCEFYCQLFATDGAKKSLKLLYFVPLFPAGGFQAASK